MPTTDARRTIPVPEIVQAHVQVQNGIITPVQPLLEALSGVPGLVDALTEHFRVRAEWGHFIHLYMPPERCLLPFLQGVSTLDIPQIIYWKPGERRGMSGCVLITRRDGHFSITSHT